MLLTNGKYNTIGMSSLTPDLCEPLTSFKCPCCDLRFPDTESLSQHYRVRDKYATHFCKYCIKRFLWQSHLQDHECTHTKEKPHICEHCGKTFAQKCNSVRHMTTCKAPKKIVEKVIQHKKMKLPVRIR